MGDETKKKTQGQDDVTDPSELSDAEKDKLIRTQQTEIDRLTKEVESLQKKLDDSEASRKAVVRKAKAETLMLLWEEAGRTFESDDAKTAELDRLLKLTDEAFAATEAAVQAFGAAGATGAGKKKKPDDEEEDEEDDDLDPNDKKKKPKKQAGLQADAGVSPGRSADRKKRQETLEDKLASGFMAAYNDRIGNEG